MSNNIDHPAHYNTGKIEVIDFIDDQKLGFCEGNTVKYICRAKHKGNELEDLKKARWYLDHAIQKLELLTPDEQATVIEQSSSSFSPYAGPFVGKRVNAVLDEWSGVVTVDDGADVVVKKDDGREARYPYAMFKQGLKQKWLVWAEEEKQNGEQEKEE